jgi:hypothetical protein
LLTALFAPSPATCGAGTLVGEKLKLRSYRMSWSAEPGPVQAWLWLAWVEKPSPASCLELLEVFAFGFFRS